jgi:diguanylate cyclase (GGDEF)-like protein
MMVDIDNFKDFNDRYGHQNGDEILRSLAGIIKTETRDGDICCRYGGEEFGIILPATPLQKAFLLGERLRKAIEKNPMDTRKITVSIGIAATAENGPLHTPQSLVKDADDALYETKANGKNCVFIKEERK